MNTGARFVMALLASALTAACGANPEDDAGPVGTTVAPLRPAGDEHGDVRIKGPAPSDLIAKGSGVAPPSLIQFSDGFEGNPSASWEGFHGGDGVPGFDINRGLARSGSN